MRTIKSKTKREVVVRAARKGIVSCLFVSAPALALLASNETSIAADPRKALGNKTPADPDIAPHTFEVLSYQDSGYRFLIIGPNETPPPGFEQPFPDFDASAAGFTEGTAAFGSGGECPLQSTVQTDWPINTQLLVRRNVFIPAG